jgi:ribosome biogenesis GTPase
MKLFGLWELEQSDLASLFVELRPLLGSCRFRHNCTHLHEPGCAIREAVAAGQISAQRYESYTRIYRDLRAKGK